MIQKKTAINIIDFYAAMKTWVAKLWRSNF